jgi:peptide deformylase
MAVKKIVFHPDPVLEMECEDVKVFDKKLKKLISDMFDTMYEADGVGLAAPQIGVPIKVAVIDTGDSEPIELINPRIIEQSGEQLGPEGCLSFPGVFGEVTRAYKIKVEAQDKKGRHFTITAEDFFARAIQHEVDHLHGILFTKKISRYLKEEELMEEERHD